MYFYLDRNYNVLLVDQRAHGHSGGRYFTLGLKESRDVEQWVNWAEAKQSDVRIILDGLSAGGAASICYAGRYAAKSLAAIISESCFTSLEAEINYIVKQRLHLPFFPVGSLFKWMIACFAKFDVKEVSPIADLKQTDIPILFIHGEKDTLVPFAMEDELYHASKSKLKKKIAVTNGKHELSREQGRQKCEREMGDFLTHVLQTK